MKDKIEVSFQCQQCEQSYACIQVDPFDLGLAKKIRDKYMAHKTNECQGRKLDWAAVLERPVEVKRK